MVTRAFLDTNVLLYAIGNDDQARRSEALFPMAHAISAQVLNEFVNVARRKHALPWHSIEGWLQGFRERFDVEPITVETQARAVAIARRHQIHIYDATIVAAAEQAGCSVLYSEDMQHGAAIAGVEIRNPY